MAKAKINYKNLNLLLKRLEEILDAPEAAQFNMRYWGMTYRSSLAGVLTSVLEQGGPVCKTQACLAGETVIATGSGKFATGGGIFVLGGFINSWDIKDQAQEDLGLTDIQANKLFFFKSPMGYQQGWPIKFEEAYENAKTPQGRLYVAIRRVEHFIKTKGKE